MRLALVSLIALTAAAASAVAQPTAPPASPPPPPPAATPAPPAASPPPAAAPASSPAPAATPGAAPGAGTSPPPPPIQTAPISSWVTQEAPPSPPPPPAPPPPPPTDPTAISVLSALTTVCIPAANGGDLGQLARAAGYRKSGDTWTLRTRDFTLVIENPGTNPSQCHVDVTHPVDQEAPGLPIVSALHDWAEVDNGWSPYRNDKSVQDGLEYTTRSWQRDQNGKAESLVFTTHRHPDGTPMQRTNDLSEMIYGVQKDAS